MTRLTAKRKKKLILLLEHEKVQKTSTMECKREAVRLAQTCGKPIAQVARELDSPMAQRIGVNSGEAFPGSGHLTVLEEENRRLKRELETTRQEGDMLKKTVGIFSHDQR